MKRAYRLNELFDLQMGKTPARNNPEYWNSEDNKWVSIADLSNCGKYIVDTKEYISNRAVEESGISLIPKNTVIMSFKLSIGKTAITSEPMYSNEAIMSFRDKHIIELLPDYLYYMFSGQDWEVGTNKAVMGKTLNKATLSSMCVKVHSIEKQREIVTVLDKVKAVLDSREEELEKLDELIKARFVEMFGDPALNPMGWEQTTLKDVAVGKLSYGSGASAIQYDGNLRYVRITDITDNGELNNDKKSPDNFDEKYLLHTGDMLFARSGATVGKTFCYDEHKHGRAIYAGYLIRMVPDKSKVLPHYVFNYTKTSYYANFVETAQRAVAQPNINAKEYGGLLICIPPIDLQEQFVTFVEQVDKSKVAIQKSLEETQLLFDSLMQEYFG